MGAYPFPWRGVAFLSLLGLAACASDPDHLRWQPDPTSIGASRGARSDRETEVESPAGEHRSREVAEAADKPLSWPAAAIYRATRDAVVRVRCGGGTGAGFLFHSPRHIATAYHVIATGREVVVVTREHEEYMGTVVAWNQERDLAIIELDRDLEGVPPLELTPYESLTQGMPVVVIGHPFSPFAEMLEDFEGLLDWSVSQGVVSAFNETFVQVDAPINPGNSGGPILDLYGRVVGVVSMGVANADGVNFAVGSDLLADLVETIGQEEFVAGWDFNIGLGSYFLVGEGGAAPAYYLSMGAVAADTYGVSLLFASPGSTEAGSNGSLQRDRSRMLLELVAEYRLLFLPTDTMPMYLNFGLGGVLEHELVTDHRLLLTEQAALCADASSCEAAASLTTETSESFHLRPMATVTFDLMGIALGYAFQANTQDLLESEHRFFLGWDLVF